MLISTDVLSEGQNLQDAGIVINYDLHWNPVRLIQRAGRVDRIGSSFAHIMLYNVFSERSWRVSSVWYRSSLHALHKSIRP
ncbi:C-terminal helicase domain-containing protein [Ktedonobacter racemifer]|uniref:C-terminal helicase domain-containing protein n=1 Tax=Ktedonobacter racemifer TaxID=363277 RepID=UPI000311668F